MSENIYVYDVSAFGSDMETENKLDFSWMMGKTEFLDVDNIKQFFNHRMKAKNLTDMVVILMDGRLFITTDKQQGYKALYEIPTSAFRSAKRSARRSAKRSVRRSAKRSVRRSAKRSVRRSAKRSVHRSAKRSVHRSAKRSVRRSAKRSVRRSAKRSVRRSAKRSVRRSAKRSAKRAIKKMPAVRPSPSAHAAEKEMGTVMVGNDGNMWVVKTDKNGKHRWAKM